MTPPATAQENSVLELKIRKVEVHIMHQGSEAGPIHRNVAAFPAAGKKAQIRDRRVKRIPDGE